MPLTDLPEQTPADYIKRHIRTVPDWPAAGIQFRDITPLLSNPHVFRVLIDQFVHRYFDLRPTAIAGLDARGFIIGSVQYSFLDVVRRDVPDEAFRGKAVIVAGTAAGLDDRGFPFAVKAPGVLSYATFLDNVFRLDFVQAPLWAWPLEWGLFFAACGLGVWLLPRLSTRLLLVGFPVLVLALLGAAAFLFVQNGIWVKVFYPALALVAPLGLVVALRLTAGERETRDVAAEKLESQKLLGLSFQEKGMLDMALATFAKLALAALSLATVGSIHGGTKHNIIPNDVKLELTVRTPHEELRQRALASFARIAKAAAAAANAPEPEVKSDLRQFIPAMVNDPELTRRCMSAVRNVLGDDRVHERPMSMGGEDFSHFVLAGVPGCYFFLGTAPPEESHCLKTARRTPAHIATYRPV